MDPMMDDAREFARGFIKDSNGVMDEDRLTAWFQQAMLFARSDTDGVSVVTVDGVPVAEYGDIEVDQFLDTAIITRGKLHTGSITADKVVMDSHGAAWRGQFIEPSK